MARLGGIDLAYLVEHVGLCDILRYHLHLLSLVTAQDGFVTGLQLT